jgi:uncharacterized protein (DUF302 family)
MSRTARGKAALIALLLTLSPFPALAAEWPGVWPSGWVVIETGKSYGELVESLDKAVADNKMGVVSRASATLGVMKVFGEDIPGNMVVGVYRPDFAKRMLEASLAAGIEAPIRFYIVEDQDADGGSTLAYRPPSLVFAPYDEGGEELDALATELDVIFERIAQQATGM